MSDHKPMLLRVEIERVPAAGELSREGWDKWCRDRYINPLVDALSGRRGWITRLDTYLREADTLVWFEGELVALCCDDDLVEP